MIQPAILYKEELHKCFIKTWYDERYKYYHVGPCFETITIEGNTWNANHFVSMKDDEVIGYIGYEINRAANSANFVHLIRFRWDDGATRTFSMDVRRCIDDVFSKYNFRKMSFAVIVGNHAEDHYRRLIEKFGGRFIGTRRQEAVLQDNKPYDMNLYEIFKESYDEQKKSRRNRS